MPSLLQASPDIASQTQAETVLRSGSEPGTLGVGKALASIRLI